MRFNYVMKFGMEAGFLILAPLFFFNSCNEKTDTDFPEIISVLPLHGDTIYSADDLNISFYIKDDNELSQLKVELYPLYDTTIYSEKTEKVFLGITRFFDLSGPGIIAFQQIPLPDNIAAFPYRLTLTATDASGNLSPSESRSVLIRNSADLEVPVVHIVNPINGATLTSGSDMNFQINATDNTGLLFCRYRILHDGTVVMTHDFTYAPGTSWGLSNNYPSIFSGNYVIEAEVFDVYLNSYKTTISFIVQ